MVDFQKSFFFSHRKLDAQPLPGDRLWRVQLEAAVVPVGVGEARVVQRALDRLLTRLDHPPVAVSLGPRLPPMELSTALATRQLRMGVVGDPGGVRGVGVVPAVVAQGGGVVAKQAAQRRPVERPLWRDNPRVVHVRQLLLGIQVARAEPKLSLSEPMAV